MEDNKIKTNADEVPVQMYYGTSNEYLIPIVNNGGLRFPDKRVPLTSTYEVAHKIAKRNCNGSEIIFMIDTRKMAEDGLDIKFNHIWTAKEVPLKYMYLLSRMDKTIIHNKKGE